MEETDTKITVSSITEITSFNMERIITISAKDVDAVTKAESQVSAKLRAAYENDIQAMAVSISYMNIEQNSNWI